MNNNLLKELEYIDICRDKYFIEEFYNNDENYINKYGFDLKIIQGIKPLLNTSIKLLSDSSSEKIWLYLFGCKPNKYQYPKGHWMNHIKMINTNVIWEGKDYLSVENSLFTELNYSKESRIFFFNNWSHMIETTWDIFIKYWMVFFDYDNESYIWCYDSSEILVVSPLGDIRMFCRPTTVCSNKVV